MDAWHHCGFLGCDSGMLDCESGMHQDLACSAVNVASTGPWCRPESGGFPTSPGCNHHIACWDSPQLVEPTAPLMCGTAERQRVSLNILRAMWCLFHMHIHTQQQTTAAMTGIETHPAECLIHHRIGWNTSLRELDLHSARKATGEVIYGTTVSASSPCDRPACRSIAAR